MLVACAWLVWRSLNDVFFLLHVGKLCESVIRHRIIFCANREKKNFIQIFQHIPFTLWEPLSVHIGKKKLCHILDITLIVFTRVDLSNSTGRVRFEIMLFHYSSSTILYVSRKFYCTNWIASSIFFSSTWSCDWIEPVTQAHSILSTLSGMHRIKDENFNHSFKSTSAWKWCLHNCTF